MEHLGIKINDGVAIVTIKRPEALNAFAQQTMHELRQAAIQLNQKPELYCVILTSDGPFTAGADLADTESINPDAKLIELRHMLKLGPEMCKAWEELDAYTICAMEKYCVGGGVALVAACDYRILSDDGFMRLPEIGLGINMSWQTLPRLVGQIGPARTKQFAIFCEKIQANEALSWGLVEEITSAGTTLERAISVSEKLRKLPPLGIKVTKQAVNRAANSLNETVSYMDIDQYLLMLKSDDFKEAISAFIGKRNPEFCGN